MNKKINYYLNQLKRADNKSNKVFKYLKNLENENYDKKLQVNINRICDIDEILSQIIICLEIDIEKHLVICQDKI